MSRLKIVMALLLAQCATPVWAQDHFFESDGVRIHYVDHGAGEPIVLIHGYTNYVERNWIDTGVLSSLAKGYRVIALGLRGHGQSGKPHAPQAYGTQLSLDIVRLLDHLQIERAHIVGYSLGQHRDGQAVNDACGALRLRDIRGGVRTAQLVTRGCAQCRGERA